MTPSVTQSNILAAVRLFLLDILPDGWKVVPGQRNRVAEPKETNFVVMTPIRQERLSTNVDTYQDAVFTGSIAGNAMSITAVNPAFTGQLEVGKTIFGVGVTAGTKITALGSGSGGIGTYTVNNAQTITNRTLAAGEERITQPTRINVQLDFHSADLNDAGDAAQTFATLFRDAYAVQQFAAQSPASGVVPLYSVDPRQMPFLNDQNAFEWRWVVEALLQANVVVSVPMQFADSVDVDLISVDAEYGP